MKPKDIIAAILKCRQIKTNTKKLLKSKQNNKVNKQTGIEL